MTHPGTTEWACICKDCGAEFRYSHTNYQANRLRGFSRPERCADCRKQHAKEVNTVGQPYFKVKPLFPNVDHEKLVSVLGRLKHPPRPHRAEHVIPPAEPPDKFGIKDDKIIEMFRWFVQDPGLQVVVVVGPTGSGKSTYFPYRLVYPPRWYETTELDPGAPPPTSSADPPARRRVLDASGEPVRFDAADVPSDLFHRYGQIVVTQPRIQATRNIPGYIARAMLGSSLGAGFDIGYQYAKNPASDWRSKLRFCTDGSLINWIATGQLDKINTVMIDEAHERSLNIDIIIGLLTQALPRYPRLKLIIASATISADLFISHFKKHLPQRAVRELWIGDETKRRRKLDEVTKTIDVPMATQTSEGEAGVPLIRQWLLKPADNCELMEFDGKSFRVDPHFHDEAKDGPALEYVYLPPNPKTAQEKRAAESVESKLQKLAKNAHEHVAKKAVLLLRDMYLSAADLGKGGGIRVTRSLNPDGTVPEKDTIVDVTERRGDILGFLHGERPILECCKLVIAETRDFKEKYGFEVEALPLFTQLPQSEQDKALLERKPGIHDRLAKRVIEQVVTGKNDVLAVSDNVGAILGLQSETFEKVLTEMLAAAWKVDKADVRKRLVVQRWSGAEAVTITPGQDCKRNEQARLLEKPTGGVRVVVGSSRALAVWELPYETAKDGDTVSLKRQSFTLLSQDRENRRVVISTNVAETSLTIHGILHVVDSGLINQNKWIPESQTTSVRAIIQSRAGCKQRWGRAGRLQAGDAWPLYTREQFGLDADVERPFGSSPDDKRCFPYYSQPEIRRSPLEQVLLTAKKAGLESLDINNFPWLEAPDADELARAERSLKAKGALDAQGRLTSHGLELSGFQSEARLANLIVIADRMACAVEMATILAVLKVQYKKLFRKCREGDDATAKRVQEVQAAFTSACGDDLEVALKVVAGAEAACAVGQALADLLAWEEKWRQTTEAKCKPANSIEKGDEAARAAVQALLDRLGTVANDDEVVKLRPPKEHPHRKVYEDVRVEVDRGIKCRHAWAQAQPQWEVLSKLPEFPDVWCEAATDATRIECVAREVLEVARRSPDLGSFVEKLDAIESESPLKRATTQPPSAGSEEEAETAEEQQAAGAKTAEDAIKARKESAEKFLTSVAETLSKFGRELPPRGAKIADTATGKERDDIEAAAAWKRLDTLAADFVKQLGERYRCPAKDTPGRTFVDAVDAARTIGELRLVAPECNPEWLARVRAALPEAAMEAWCDAHFVDRRAISDKDKIQAARDELIDSLSGHKKEEERRPINFALLPRLRLILAHALPDHCYMLDGSGYQSVVPEGGKLPAVIERDSICASRPPKLMVCVNRRALPADKNGEARLGAGFVVSLDGEDLRLTPDLIRGNPASDGAARAPLSKWSPFELAAHLPEVSPEQAAQQTAAARDEIMFDQSFPMHSRWQFTLQKRVGDLDWLVATALKELKPRILVETRNQIDEDEVGADGDAGGESTSSTFAYEMPEPVLAEEAPDDPEKRPIFLREGEGATTPLAEEARAADREQHEALLHERDEAREARATTDVNEPPPCPSKLVAASAPPAVRIRFASPPTTDGGGEREGAVVNGWVLGREMDGAQPIVLVGRRSPEESLRELELGTTRTVQVIGRTFGAKPGLRVRILDSEIYAIMTPRDFCFRDDDAVIDEFMSAFESAENSKTLLTFPVTVWDLAPDRGVLRLVTLPRAADWWKQYEKNGKSQVTGTFVRSNPARPDRVSVILHSDPSQGLVIVAEASDVEFGSARHRSQVQVKVDRARAGGRSPDVRRACPAHLREQLQRRDVEYVAPKERFDGQASENTRGDRPKGEKTRFVSKEPMGAELRFELIALAPDDAGYCRTIDELYDQSNWLIAQDAGRAAALTAFLQDASAEIVARVTELNSGGARLATLDPQHPAAGTTLWLPKGEGGGAEGQNVGDVLLVRPAAEQDQIGQLKVTLRLPPGILTNGMPIAVERHDDTGDVRSLRVRMHSGAEMFCPANEVFANAPDIIPTLIDPNQAIPVPFLLLPPDPNRKQRYPVLSHRGAVALALRCRNPKLVGQLVKGTVSRPWFVKDGRDIGEVQVAFGRKFRAIVPIAQLGIGFWSLIKPDVVSRLDQGPFDMIFQFEGWDEDDLPLLSAQPVWTRVIETTLVNRMLVGEVVEIRSPFINVRVAPFLIGTCHVSELGTEHINRIEDVVKPGQLLSLHVTGIDAKGNLQISPREAALCTLEQSVRARHRLIGTVSRVVGGGSLIIDLGEGISGYCPSAAMPTRVQVGDRCEVCVTGVNRSIDKGTPVRLSAAGLPSGRATKLAELRGSTASPAQIQLPAPTLQLANAIDTAANELMVALRGVEEALSSRDLASAETAIVQLRTSFPLNAGEVCLFARRLKLLRDTHDQLFRGGLRDRALLVWPSSPVVAPDPPVSAEATLGGDSSVIIRWRTGPDTTVGTRFHVVRRAFDQIHVLTESVDGIEVRDPSPPQSTHLTYEVSAVANARRSSAIAAEPIIVPGDVNLISAAADMDGSIRIEWRIPEAASSVEIWRKPDEAPRARYDGRLIARDRVDSYVDIGLPKGRVFGYRVIAVYGAQASRGVTLSGPPFLPMISAANAHPPPGATTTSAKPTRGGASFAGKSKGSPRPNTDRKLRVHVLAKELGISSQEIIERCAAKGIELKNHMHVLNADLEATIREWFE